MKNLIVFLLAVFVVSCVSEKTDKQFEKLKFDYDWKFSLGDHPDAFKVDFNDSNWRSIDIPHDFSIEQPFDSLNPSGTGGAYAYGGIGWYRKHFVIPEKYRGKRFEIQFNGVYRNAEVWLNGKQLGVRPYGYSTFRLKLTDFLNEPGKDNVIAVRVNTKDQPNSRWYTGSGIYRHVWLRVSDLTHFVSDGVFVKTISTNKENAEISASIEIKNDKMKPEKCILTTQIIKSNGNIVVEQASSFNIAAEEFFLLNQKFNIENPVLWSVENPYLYKVKSVLETQNGIIETFEQNIGIRTFSFDAEKGFFLNGEHLKLKGVNNHHDGGPLGSACYDYTFERQLKILKSMGCNAIRMSHNPPAPELLDCADSLGFIVIDEIFDEWTYGKTKFGYSLNFNNWYAKDVTSWIRRDRNHPSVIAWSLGNEVPEQKANDGKSILEKIRKVAQKSDSSRPFTSACNEVPGVNATGFYEFLDIMGYNYQERMYAEDHAKYPDRVIYGSETAIYPYHPGNEFPLHTYGEWLEGQLSDYVAGEFLWTGFDYLGEAGIGKGGTSTEPWKYWPKWPWRSAVCGVVDLCGFEKPAYWFRKALWSEEPFVYIAVPYNESANDIQKAPFWGWPEVWSHWNHNKEGETLKVQVYTNCKENELFLNGKSLGKKEWDIRKEAFLTWDVPYSAGKLEVEGISEDGKKVNYFVETTGQPYALKMTSEKDILKADRQDVSYVKVEVVDENGRIIPFADNKIKFNVEGEGKLVSVGNGNPESHTSFKGDQMEAYHGRCLAIVSAKEEKGNLLIKASAEGLQPAELIIKVGNKK